MTAPKEGSIVWLDFGETQGHEQEGYRPALVISRDLFNKVTETCVVCPITTKDKGFLFSIPLTKKLKTQGFVMVHQIRTMDWKKRRLRYIEQASEETLMLVREVATKIIGNDA